MKFIQKYRTNIPFFFNWFKEYAKGKGINYPFSSSLWVTTRSTQIWITLKGEKIIFELPLSKSFIVETKDSHKLVIAFLFKIHAKQLFFV